LYFHTEKENTAALRNNNWLTQNPIAHRGLHDGNKTVPENSLSAFAKAITAGYPIELDIQIISDGTVIVFHDSDLKRICGVSTSTRKLTVSTLKNYTLFSTSEKIPTLTEVLQLVNGQVPLVIELKTETLNKGLEKNLLQLLTKYQGAFALQSFNPSSVRWLQKHTSYFVGQLAEASLAFKPFNKIVEYLQLNKSHSPDFIGYDIALFPNKTITHFQEKGIPILAWTVRTQNQIEHKSHYFDNIIFEGFIPEKVN